MIGKNSGNSSKPPSTYGFKKINNSRKAIGRKAGGQKGHAGHRPVLFEKPTKIIELKVPNCKCGGKVRYRDQYKRNRIP